jgi:hypothetical protein
MDGEASPEAVNMLDLSRSGRSGSMNKQAKAVVAAEADDSNPAGEDDAK